MAKAGDPDILRPSVLDRLLEGAGGRRRRSETGISLRDLKRSVARDLEWLLNSNRVVDFSSGGLEEASRSILAFGIPDVSPYSWRSSTDADALCRILQSAIRTFEPRLSARSIRVSVSPSRSVQDFRLAFRIDALIQVEPFNEPVRFDSHLDFDTGTVHITGTE